MSVPQMLERCQAHTFAATLTGMGTLDDVGERAGWRCWVCDQTVDPDASVNDGLGPSIDRFEFAKKGKGGKSSSGPDDERLAHRSCNTKKGAVSPVIAWPDDLIIFDPAPILQATERLLTKGGREMVARCASKSDAKQTSEWLLDRLSRLAPGVAFTTVIAEGGGQQLITLIAPK
jgi:hypothetical protein